MRVEIRDARPEDAAAVASLLTELGYPTVPDVARRRLEAFARGQGPQTVRVAERADGPPRAVVALMTVSVNQLLHRDTPTAQVTALVVAAEVRGEGVGRALIADAQALALAAGCGKLFVRSNKVRTAAHAFYRQLGGSEKSLDFDLPLRPPPTAD